MSDEEQKEETVRDRAAKLFKPPFKFDGTYIWDAQGEMLADNRVPDGATLQARGWGRLTGVYAMALPESEARDLQRAYGELIAEALNAHWPKGRKSTCEPWCGEDGKTFCADAHPGRDCYSALGHYCSPECAADASASRKK